MSMHVRQFSHTDGQQHGRPEPMGRRGLRFHVARRESEVASGGYGPTRSIPR